LRLNNATTRNLRFIADSPQSRTLTDVTLALPHLSLQSVDEALGALLGWSLLPQIHTAQIGLTSRDWRYGAPAESDAAIEGDAPSTLVRLVQQMPALQHLCLAVYYHEMGPILRAAFPPELWVLRLSTWAAIDLGLIAANESLARLRSLAI